jgi:hypothetical protein
VAAFIIAGCATTQPCPSNDKGGAGGAAQNPPVRQQEK